MVRGVPLVVDTCHPRSDGRASRRSAYLAGGRIRASIPTTPRRKWIATSSARYSPVYRIVESRSMSSALSEGRASASASTSAAFHNALLDYGSLPTRSSKRGSPSGSTP